MLKKAQAHLREQRVGEHVVNGIVGQGDLPLPGRLLQLRGQGLHLRRQAVGRALRQRLGAVENASLQGGVHRCRGGAVLALEHPRRLLGDGLVALSRQHVEHGLGADDLRGGGNQRDHAQVLAHLGDFLEHLVQAVERVLLAQLIFQIGQHAAGYLGDEDA